MTVRADASALQLEHDGVTYYFCCVGCRDAYHSRLGS
jgi:YHS domain-containing protein